MKRVAVFLYGVLSYAVFFLTFLYALGFIGNFYVPKSMDSGAQIPFLKALLVDALLLGIFAVQHSVMARPAFKRVLTQVIPEPAERSTYVLFSSIALIALFKYWQPIGGVIWNVENPLLRLGVTLLFLWGFLVVLISTLLINHFDLFGLRQVWLYLIKQAVHAPRIPHAVLLQVRAASAVCWLVHRLLGDADHDRSAPAVRDPDLGVHADGNPVGRARPARHPRKALRGLPQRSAEAGAVIVAVSRGRGEYTWEAALRRLTCGSAESGEQRAFQSYTGARARVHMLPSTMHLIFRRTSAWPPRLLPATT